MAQEFTQAQLEAAAFNLLAKMVLKDGGKLPSVRAVEIAARTLAARAMRERAEQANSPASDAGPFQSDLINDGQQHG